MKIIIVCKRYSLRSVAILVVKLQPVAMIILIAIRHFSTIFSLKKHFMPFTIRILTKKIKHLSKISTKFCNKNLLIFIALNWVVEFQAVVDMILAREMDYIFWEKKI